MKINMLPDHGQIGPIAGSKGLLRPSGEVPQQLGRGSSPRPGNANPPIQARRGLKILRYITL